MIVGKSTMWLGPEIEGRLRRCSMSPPTEGEWSTHTLPRNVPALAELSWLRSITPPASAGALGPMLSSAQHKALDCTLRLVPDVAHTSISP